MGFFSPHPFQLWKPNRIQQWYANQLEVRLNPLNWLQQWYSDQLCHQDGNSVDIKIYNIDNPGWGLDIKLKGTALEAVPFKEIKINRSEHEWLFCRVLEGVFDSAGDTFKLFEILQTYQNWVTSTGSIVNVDDTRNRYLLLQWLQEWFCSQCDGSWEHMFQGSCAPLNLTQLLEVFRTWTEDVALHP